MNSGPNKNSQASLTKNTFHQNGLNDKSNENSSKNLFKFKLMDPKSKLRHKTKKDLAALYDTQGIHRHSGMDLCDCMIVSCPGCHFPCPTCQSNKW